MAAVNGPFELSYRECREVWESYFGTHCVTGTTFSAMAQEVYDRAGPTEFKEILGAVRELHRSEDENKLTVGG